MTGYASATRAWRTRARGGDSMAGNMRHYKYAGIVHGITYVIDTARAARKSKLFPGAAPPPNAQRRALITSGKAAAALEMISIYEGLAARGMPA